MSQLIQPLEVIQGGTARPSPADIRLDKTLVSPHIQAAEYRWVRETLGASFYDALVAEKGSFNTIVPINRVLFYDSQTNVLVLPASANLPLVTNTETNVAVYQNGQKLIQTINYTIGGSTITIDINTHFDGSNYEVIIYGKVVSTETSVFTTSAYQTLWDTHLKSLCANAVLYEASPYIVMQLGTNGLYLIDNEYGKNAGMEGVKFYQDTLRQRITLQQNMIKDYLCASASIFPYFSSSAIGCPDGDCGGDDDEFYNDFGLIL